MSVIVEQGKFKGKPVLTLKRNDEDRYPFSFGLAKAKLIMEAYDEIKEFVEEEDKKEKDTKDDEG